MAKYSNEFVISYKCLFVSHVPSLVCCAHLSLEVSGKPKLANSDRSQSKLERLFQTPPINPLMPACKKMFTVQM